MTHVQVYSTVSTATFNYPSGHAAHDGISCCVFYSVASFASSSFCRVRFSTKFEVVHPWMRVECGSGDFQPSSSDVSKTVQYKTTIAADH